MNNKKRLYSGIAIAAALIITAGVIVFLITLFDSTNEEPQTIIGADFVEFTGMYGAAYKFSDIHEIRLDDSMPAATYKYNGAGLGEVKKGDYEVEGLGRCRLFVMSETGPYVVIGTTNGYVIINYKESKKTKELYQSLQESIG
jgi:hypothetical protein